ncbi:hypothetical protein PLESTB_000824600 [Pleodorina starrii]|uniref:BTB domain-containing protein n=1 Tax=Pleodorina starrii TaxID=330485 RepID=A0A9W6BL45_9CHLO|nr:hypothetical protein PLESTM_000140000 [Pleodorina starrii]GLC54109.1 hypothetical protein PLESTB_000824600 [Pleodorina starrii]GLC64588.1 hypothetical protein PLESTF_000182000 [Pleodorina starrii]
MAQRGNKHVLDGLSGLFGSEEDADCTIIFYMEKNPVDDGPRKRQRREEESSEEPEKPSQPAVFGAPLPAHRLVLRRASERFRSQFERWTDTSTRPELRIPLRSEDEVPAARAAIQYAYTGEVKEGGGVRGLLAVRRQAQYLDMKGCTADCDAALKRVLKDGAAAQELYQCEAIWPDPTAEEGFAAVLKKAVTRLAAHFGDALKTLNTPSLLVQLLALPAVALEALLGSDDFGTDSESSILMVLALWMFIPVNRQHTDKQTRERLCRTVRLAHVSVPYRHLVVPALAADFIRANPSGAAGWFSVDPVHAAFATSLSTLTDAELKCLLDDSKSDPWVVGSGRLLDLTPRPQCILREGLTFAWSLDQQDLLKGLQALEPGCAYMAAVLFDQTGRRQIAANGFEWSLGIHVTREQRAAGLYLECWLPSVYQESGGPLLGMKAVVSIDARVTVHRWQGGSQRDIVETWDEDDPIVIGGSLGEPDVLPLLPPKPGTGARGGGRQPPVGGHGADGGSPLAAWGEYLRGGKITGSLKLMRPPS